MNELLIGSPDMKEIDEVISRYKGKNGELLGILEETQLLNDHKFLSEDALDYVSVKTGVPLTRIYNVVTFYSFFNLKPQGKHTVAVCRGTACHTKGSKTLLDDLGLILNCKKELEEGEPFFTTPDNQFTISTVACFGQCALAPVIAIDGIIYSNVTSSKLQKLIGRISKVRKRV
jgi:NADH-quinone oxidoreductase subunit E